MGQGSPTNRPVRWLLSTGPASHAIVWPSLPSYVRLSTVRRWADEPSDRPNVCPVAGIWAEPPIPWRWSESRRARIPLRAGWISLGWVRTTGIREYADAWKRWWLWTRAEFWRWMGPAERAVLWSQCSVQCSWSQQQLRRLLGSFRCTNL